MPTSAKIENYSSDVRIDEGAVYTKLTLNFTEEIPNTITSEIISEVELSTETEIE